MAVTSRATKVARTHSPSGFTGKRGTGLVLSGSWPPPRASIYQAIASLSEEKKYLVLKGPGRRPTAPDSPEKSVPALALVGHSDEGVHGSHPQPRVAHAPSWVLRDVASPGGLPGSDQSPGGRDCVSPPTRGWAHLRKHGFLEFRLGPEVVVTKATPSHKTV